MPSTIILSTRDGRSGIVRRSSFCEVRQQGKTQATSYKAATCDARLGLTDPWKCSLAATKQGKTTYTVRKNTWVETCSRKGLRAGIVKASQKHDESQHEPQGKT